MENKESKKVIITRQEINIVKEKIKKMKIILVSENIKVDHMEQEVWELFLAHKILKEETTETMKQTAELFLTTMIERSPEDILYMLRNEDLFTMEDAKIVQSEQKIEWIFDQPIKQEEFMNTWLSFVTLDMPILIRKRSI